MALPFTVEQFYGVFRDYNATVWPMQWVLVALAVAAIVAALRPRPGSGMAVSAILGVLWAWILDLVIQGNTAQMADAAFVKGLEAWIRFNGAQAVRTGDGLSCASSGNPNIPTWVGDLSFRWVFTPKDENDKYARQVRSSAGLGAFVGQAADKAHRVEMGGCYERFGLQATALGIRNAFLNQAVEVAAVRSPFAAALGLADHRSDLVVRFGRGPVLPRSLRRPVESVMD